MPELELTLTAAAAQAQVMACALAAGRRIDRWSLALAAVALLGLVLAATPLPLSARLCLLASLLAAGMQQILALRLAFDEIVFQKWAEKWAGAAVLGSESCGYVEDLAAFDQGLAACGLRAPSSGVVRDMDNRVKGAMGLLKKLVLAFALQVVATVSAAVLISLMPVG